VNPIIKKGLAIAKGKPAAKPAPGRSTGSLVVPFDVSPSRPRPVARPIVKRK
jgi:hypothetical protein